MINEANENRIGKLFLILFGTVLLTFSITYYGYIYYIYSIWGGNDRFLSLLLVDILIVLFFPVAVGCMMRKKWGWWLTMITFFVFALSKVVALLSTLYLYIIDSSDESLFLSFQTLDILLLSFYLFILFIFSTHFIKVPFFSHTLPSNRRTWKIISIAGSLIYLIYLGMIATIL